jgi:hypothetical protein
LVHCMTDFASISFLQSQAVADLSHAARPA